MPRSQPRKRPLLGRLPLALCLVLAGLLATFEARAADILLTGAQDSPGVQSFTQALKALRPKTMCASPRWRVCRHQTNCRPTPD